MIEEFKEAYRETLARKRAEFEAALERGDIADPITGTILTIATLKAIAISAAVSTVVAAASYGLSRAFAPKPPRQQFGKMTGSLQIQNSEQGIMIPEIYGAGPDVTIVAGSNPTYQNLTNTTAGAGGAITKTSGADNDYNAGASHNVAVSSGDAFLQVTRGTGHAAAGFFDTASPTGSGGLGIGCIFGVAWSPDGTLYGVIDGIGIVVGSASVAGDVFRIEYRSGRFHLYKGSAELDMNRPQPTPSFPIYLGVIMYSTGAGVSAAKVQIGSIGDAPNAGRGGVKVPAIIVWTSGIRKNVSVTQTPVRGGKGGGSRTQTTENFSYDIDLRLNFAKGPLRLLREYANADVNLDQYAQSAIPSGVYDPTVPADAPYDPNAPPDPQTDYPTRNRVDGEIEYDVNNTGTGTVQGGGSLFAIYEGNATQEPDPTEEADIDAKYGAGSTTAYHNQFGITHKQFDLSRTSGIVPNFTAALEHTTLKTLDDIYGSLCERVGVNAANDDYDFSGLSAIASRGMLIAGRLFQPAEVIGSPEMELAYSYFVTEVEGQLVGFAEGDEPEIEIDDTEIGWLDGESDVPDIIPELESILASEILLPREVIVKSIDPDKEWDSNTASARRQVTDGVATELLEIQIAQLTDERRATAQRGLYRAHVGGTAHKFTLPWTYLYAHAGTKLIINRAEGFTHTLRITSITGGIGVLDCEGIALEPEVFNQPATGPIGIPSTPSQMIPAMTVMSLLDTPLLRDGDVTNNDGVGWYVVGTPRTGFNQSWHGFNLLMHKNNEWQFKAESRLPGTVGTVVSVTSLSTNPDVIDTVGEIVVDLYGTTQTLSSVAEADIQNNLGLFGTMLANFADATQVANFPNRWTLSTLLNGQKDTEHLIADLAAGDRFVLINEAVKFVPMDAEDLDTEFDYKAVTVGQSQDDAATIPAVWTGDTTRPRHPRSFTGAFDEGTENLLQEWLPGSVADVVGSESYEIEERDGAGVGAATVRGPVPIVPLQLSRESQTPPLRVVEDTGFLLKESYIWMPPGGFDFIYSFDEHVTLGAWVQSTALIEPAGGFIVEAEVAPPLATIPRYFPRYFAVAASDDAGPTFWWSAAHQATGMIHAEGIEANEFPIVPGDRMTMVGSPDGTLSYYFNYLGASSQPIYVSPTKIDFSKQYKIEIKEFINLTDDGVSTFGVRNVRWLRHVPEFTYTADMQLADNADVLPETVYARVRQMSFWSFGKPSHWVYGSFVRPPFG